MRRDEFSSTDTEEFDYITKHAEVGHLGLIDTKGYPRIIPLNFAAIDKTIYVHGAKAGEKYELLQSSPRATFSVDIPYSFIPSHWQSARSASPATHFFKSLHIRGQSSPVEDNAEKAAAFRKMLVKYQPEGKYDPIDHEVQLYKNAISEVGVWKIQPNEITMKIKFGQNITEKKIIKIIQELKVRNKGLDKFTVKEIIKYYPKSLDLNKTSVNSSSYFTSAM